MAGVVGSIPTRGTIIKPRNFRRNMKFGALPGDRLPGKNKKGAGTRFPRLFILKPSNPISRSLLYSEFVKKLRGEFVDEIVGIIKTVLDFFLYLGDFFRPDVGLAGDF